MLAPLFLAIVVWGTHVDAQAASQKEINRATEQLRKDFPSALFEQEATTGRVTAFLKTATPEALVSSDTTNTLVKPEQLVRDFLKKYNGALGPLEESMRITSRPEFRVDGAVVRVQQYFRNIKVEGAQATFTTSDDEILGLQAQSLETLINVPTAPKVTHEHAAARARFHYDKYLAELPDSDRGLLTALDGAVPTVAKSELVIYDPEIFGKDGPYRLTWKVSVGSLVVYIDATNTSTVYAYESVQHLVPRRLTQDCEGNTVPGQLVLGDGAPMGIPIVPEAQAAHDISEQVAEYFRVIHGETAL